MTVDEWVERYNQRCVDLMTSSPSGHEVNNTGILVFAHILVITGTLVFADILVITGTLVFADIY